MNQDTELSYTRLPGPISVKWGLVPKILSTLTLFFTVAGVGLYAFGRFYDQAFLSHFGLSSQWFTASKETYIQQGFAVATHYVTLDFAKSQLVVIVSFFFIVLILCVYDFFIAWGKPANTFHSWRQAYLRPLLADQSTVEQRLKATTVVMIVSVGILFLTSFLLNVLMTPIRYGTQWGSQAAQDLVHTLSTDEQASSARFVELHKEDKLLAKGYPIAYGEGRIALYDPKTQTVRTFHTDDVEVRRKLSLDLAPSALPKP